MIIIFRTLWVISIRMHVYVHRSVCEHVFISKCVDVNIHCTSVACMYVSVTNTYCVCGKLEVPLDLAYYLARLLCWPQWPCQLFQWPRNAHQYNRGRNRRQQFPRGGKDSLPGPFDLCRPRFLFQSKSSEFRYWLIHSEMRETFKTTVFCGLYDAPDFKTYLGFRGRK